MAFHFCGNATTYYISSSQGNDSNDGLSSGTPFQTLDKLYNMTFKPGDRILFLSGDTWKGMFWLKGSGSNGNPIIVDKYGGDAKPIIDGDGFQSSILIYNDDYIEINNLELVNEASHLLPSGAFKKLRGFEGTGLNIRFGLEVVANTKSLVHFRISNLDIHNIYPTPTNINNTHKGYGIKFGAQSSYNISDVVIDNCYITETGHYGVWIFAATNKNDQFTIAHSTFYHTGGSGLVSLRTRNILVERCVFDNTGSSIDPRMWKRGSGLWPYKCNDVIIQENKFLNAHGPQDSYGAHIDFGNENVVIQYNYSYNNEGGFVEILGDNINCGYRYNISVNDGYRLNPNNVPWQKKGALFWVSDWCGPGAGCQNINTFIYNNTVYVPRDLNPEIVFKANTGNTLFYNNLIYVQSGGDTINTSLPNTGNYFDISNNLYYPQSRFNFDADLINNAIYLDPLLESPGANDPMKYRLLENSPAIQTGKLINGSSNPLNYSENNGGRDYFNNTVSSTVSPNIGAYNGVGIVVLSVDPGIGKKKIKVYPNPNKGLVNIDLGGLANALIEVFTATGQLVYQKADINTAIHRFKFDKAPGVYFIEISAQGWRQHYKLFLLQK